MFCFHTGGHTCFGLNQIFQMSIEIAKAQCLEKLDLDCRVKQSNSSTKQQEQT